MLAKMESTIVFNCTFKPSCNVGRNLSVISAKYCKTALGVFSDSQKTPDGNDI